MGEVVELNIPTTVDIPPDDVLRGAIETGMREAMVIGFDCDGRFYIASSNGSVADNLLLVEMARNEVMFQIDS